MQLKAKLFALMNLIVSAVVFGLPAQSVLAEDLAVLPDGIYFPDCLDPVPPPVDVQPFPQRPVAIVEPPPRGAFHAEPLNYPNKSVYFALLSSHYSAEEAMRRLARLQTCSFDVEFAVFPPFHPNDLWHVVSAAFASEPEAQAEVDFARRSGLARNPRLDRYTFEELAERGEPYRVYPPSVTPLVWPNYLVPSATVSTTKRRTFVEIGRAPTQQMADVIASFVRERFPGVNIAVFSPRDPNAVAQLIMQDLQLAAPDPRTQWTVMLATNQTRAEAKKAVHLADRLGLESRVFEESGPSDGASWIPHDTFLVSQAAAKRQKIESCYAQGRLTIGEMIACSGYLLTPRSLADCLGRDLDRPPTFDEVADTQYEACFARAPTQDQITALAAQGLKLDSPLKLTAELLYAVPTAEKLLYCQVTAHGDPAVMVDCVLPEISDGDALEVGKCLANSRADGTIACFLSLQGNSPASEAVACLVQNGSNDIGDCIGEALPSDVRAKMANCLADRDALDAIASCLDSVDGGASVRSGLAKVQCASRAAQTSDPLAAAACVTDDSGALAQARSLYGCTGFGDELEVAACVASATGVDDKNLAHCLLVNKDDPLACSDDPSITKIHAAVACVRAAGDTAAMIENCATGVDPKAIRTAACLARSDGETQGLATCAAGALLPGEYGRLAACAATSQGATSFALCAAGPSMNEEWRIAAECAVSSGGVPVTFAVCAGGRLTVRELLRCTQGRIGEACFGPNNTIRKYYENSFHDLLHGPGEGNDVVKGLKSLRASAEEAGKEIATRAAELKKGLERQACNAFGSFCDDDGHLFGIHW